jgi:hypothetical protein
MDNVGGLIFFAALGAYICAKAQVPGGAVVFALVAAVLFLGTPVGAHVPGFMSSLMNAVDKASSPALTGVDEAGVDEAGGDR